MTSRAAPTEIDRTQGERPTLEGMLRFYQDVLGRKLDGVSDTDARLVQTKSGMSILGVVNHAANVHLWWYVHVLTGEKPEYSYTDADVEVDPDCDWWPEASGADVLDFFDRCCEIARLAAAEVSLDTVVTIPERDSQVSLRWIHVHMIEELARHAGHLDVMREAVDGVVGD